MKHEALFIGATGQHVGKTTISLGLNAALRKRFNSVGFIKPVGQQHVPVEGVSVDKDVYLFRELFHMSSDWKDMSPVIIPQGFTKDYLDGKISNKKLMESIIKSFNTISGEHEFTLVEGTGHIGVGSIIELSNARVAKELNLDIVIIASGGLGSSFDELSLNIALCKEAGLRIHGVILNKVIQEKMEKIRNYFEKALKRHNIPLIGCIPFEPLLTKPTIQDFESLFKTTLLSGQEHRMRHFASVRLMAGSADTYREEMIENELIITPASREDIITITLMRHKAELKEHKTDFQGGMILTGRHAPSKHIIEEIKKCSIPILYAPLCSYDAMQLITSYTAKLLLEDKEKIEKVIGLVEKHVDIERLVRRSLSPV
ncbi:phosphotransacetylase family protein [Estrella lausannensis]|uniref:Putative cobyrinic acid a,c-diamide synthase family protein n=1 Tax=Estrella lausannensis TaxID=483423 RepID=A0A0H5DSE2_9BACT|nr:AAA family ATPase [Estrella lausannensis]CRX38684.1 putative cobyrinic acid a,c-diamide synthase family protein [Estrella lausannensis]